MRPFDLTKVIQSRTARIAVGASTVRRSGAKDTVKAARAYLRRVDLAVFVTPDVRQFQRALNRHTERLRRSLPRGAQHWGIARKVMNIFLRDCAYTTYLSAHFGLERIEAFLEIPLDSVSYAELKKTLPRGALPSWPGVRGVTPALNARAQAAAVQTAASMKVVRIHLDAYWWSVSRDEG